MYSYSTKQLPSIDEITRKGSTVYMYDNTSVFGTILRKESVMATLKKRRNKWYARVLWYDETGYKKEKQIPLRTESKTVARERLVAVNREEVEIKDGLKFSFPWLNEDGATKVIRFTVELAAEEWMKRREKNGIRPKTIEMNWMGLNHFMNYVGKSMPLASISTSNIDGFNDLMKGKGLSVTSINIYLRTLKTMFRYFWKRERLDRIPMIEQLSLKVNDPIYISDVEFQSIMELDWLDSFYKRVYFFYRETGLRLREPFMSKLDGFWLDIPNQSKGKRPRSIELSKSLINIYGELMEWYNTCGLVELSKGVHLSKVFKKALRSIGASEDKHFHSLRHTFAVRRIVENVPIYKIKKMMGHSSVTTTELYAEMELKRLSHDFPTLSPFVPKNGKVDTELVDTTTVISSFLEEKVLN